MVCAPIRSIIHELKLLYYLFVKAPTSCLFILSSEFNAYLKKIKVVLSTLKKNRIRFLFFFTVANRDYFDNIGLNFFPKRSGMHCSCLTLRYGCTHVN